MTVRDKQGWATLQTRPGGVGDEPAIRLNAASVLFWPSLPLQNLSPLPIIWPHRDTVGQHRTVTDNRQCVPECVTAPAFVGGAA